MGEGDSFLQEKAEGFVTSWQMQREALVENHHFAAFIRWEPSADIKPGGKS